MRVEALVETLANPVPDAETKTPLDSLSDTEGRGTNGHSSRGRGKKTWRHIEECEGDTLVDTLDDNLTEGLAQTLGDRLSDVEVEALGNTLRSR